MNDCFRRGPNASAAGRGGRVTLAARRGIRVVGTPTEISTREAFKTASTKYKGLTRRLRKRARYPCAPSRGDNMINDQVAAITGASSGIGRATASYLARAGAKVVLGARHEEGQMAIRNRSPCAGRQINSKINDELFVCVT